MIIHVDPSTDTTYDVVVVATWALLEAHPGLWAASFPGIHPLLRLCTAKIKKNASRTSRAGPNSMSEPNTEFSLSQNSKKRLSKNNQNFQNSGADSGLWDAHGRIGTGLDEEMAEMAEVAEIGRGEIFDEAVRRGSSEICADEECKKREGKGRERYNARWHRKAERYRNSRQSSLKLETLSVESQVLSLLALQSFLVFYATEFA